MADITNLFRATVKSVRVRLKASNKHESEYGHGGETSKAVDQSILKVKTKSKSDFEKKAQSVVSFYPPCYHRLVSNPICLTNNTYIFINILIKIYMLFFKHTSI